VDRGGKERALSDGGEDAVVQDLRAFLEQLTAAREM